MVGEQRPSSSGHGTPGQSSRGRLLWLVLAVVGLLALVSVGSLRQAPGAGAGTRHFPSALVQTLGLLAAIAVVLGAVVFASTLLPGERVRRRRNPVFMPSMLLGFVLLLAVLRRLGWLEKLQFPSLRPQTSRTSLPTPTTPPSGRLPGSGPAWVPFVVVGALALALAVVMVVRGDRRVGPDGARAGRRRPAAARGRGTARVRRTRARAGERAARLGPAARRPVRAGEVQPAHRRRGHAGRSHRGGRHHQA